MQTTIRLRFWTKNIKRGVQRRNSLLFVFKKLADFALSIGFYISASGIITFNKSGELRDIFAEVPLDRLLVETDAPFLAPVPMRGRRNESSFVVHTAEKLAQIKDVPLEKLAQITSDNFYRLFRKASDKGRYAY